MTEAPQTEAVEAEARDGDASQRFLDAIRAEAEKDEPGGRDEFIRLRRFHGETPTIWCDDQKPFRIGEIYDVVGFCVEEAVRTPRDATPRPPSLASMLDAVRAELANCKR